LLCASVLLAPFAILSWPQNADSAALVGKRAPARRALHGIAYLIYFRLIYRVGATRAVHRDVPDSRCSV
jgi:hypothetical protein